MNYPIDLSYKGNCWKARLLKKATLSTGYVVYFFERKTDKPVIGFEPFIVAVKSPLDRTIVFEKFTRCELAVSSYLHYLCCYA